MEPLMLLVCGPRFTTSISPESLNARQQGLLRLGSVSVRSRAGTSAGPAISYRYITFGESMTGPDTTKNFTAPAADSAGENWIVLFCATVAVAVTLRYPVRATVTVIAPVFSGAMR